MSSVNEKLAYVEAAVAKAAALFGDACDGHRAGQRRAILMSDDTEFSFPGDVSDITEVPGEFRALYEAKSGGGYAIKPSVAKLRDNPILKGALDKERASHKASAKKAKAAEEFIGQIAQVLEVADQNEVLTRIEELRGRASPQAKDAVRAEIEGRFKQTIEQERREKEKLKTALTETLVDREVQAAIGAARGNLKALFPHVKQSVHLIEEDGRTCSARPRLSGAVRYRDDGLPMTSADFVNELRRDADFAPKLRRHW